MILGYTFFLAMFGMTVYIGYHVFDLALKAKLIAARANPVLIYSALDMRKETLDKLNLDEGYVGDATYDTYAVNEMRKSLHQGDEHARENVIRVTYGFVFRECVDKMRAAYLVYILFFLGFCSLSLEFSEQMIIPSIICGVYITLKGIGTLKECYMPSDAMLNNPNSKLSEDEKSQFIYMKPHTKDFHKDIDNELKWFMVMNIACTILYPIMFILA